MGTDPRSRSIDIMARTIWGEARGEGRAGMEAVAAVIMNRVKYPRWWGTDVASVCTKPYQFSCWNSDDPNRPKILAVTGKDPAFVTALEVAQNAVDGKLPDPTGGADSYYSIFTHPPVWAEHAVHTCTIGHHAFYRTEIPAPHPTVTADDLNDHELQQLDDEHEQTD
jgi:spore germination cell wall hydrolase CwlJ-like protein